MGCGSTCDPGFGVRVFGGAESGRGGNPQESHYFCRDHRQDAEECRTTMRLRYPSLNT